MVFNVGTSGIPIIDYFLSNSLRDSHRFRGHCRGACARVSTVQPVPFCRRRPPLRFRVFLFFSSSINLSVSIFLTGTVSFHFPAMATAIVRYRDPRYNIAACNNTIVLIHGCACVCRLVHDTRGHVAVTQHSAQLAYTGAVSFTNTFHRCPPACDHNDMS